MEKRVNNITAMLKYFTIVLYRLWSHLTLEESIKGEESNYVSGIKCKGCVRYGPSILPCMVESAKAFRIQMLNIAKSHEKPNRKLDNNFY